MYIRRAAAFPAVAGILAWRKIRKTFSGFAKFANGLFQLDEILIGLIRLGEVCQDFTVLTEISALCAAKGMLRSDSLKIKMIRLMTNFNQ